MIFGDDIRLLTTKVSPPYRGLNNSINVTYFYVCVHGNRSNFISKLHTNYRKEFGIC